MKLRAPLHLLFGLVSSTALTACGDDLGLSGLADGDAGAGAALLPDDATAPSSVVTPPGDAAPSTADGAFAPDTAAPAPDSGIGGGAADAAPPPPLPPPPDASA